MIRVCRWAFFVAVILLPASGFACDLCAIYSSLDIREAKANSLRLSVAEQFTMFDRLQNGGSYQENEEHERIESSITQVVGEYDFSEKLAIQFSLPLIHRSYRQASEGGSMTGSESGLGDLSLLLRLSPRNYRTSELVVLWDVFLGVKFPTGDSDRLGDEHHEMPAEEDAHDGEHDAEDEHEGMHHEHHSFSPRHGDEDHGVASGVHGHDLTLGSGSYDFPFGASVVVVQDKWLGEAEASYFFRTEGDFGYRYANDFLWGLGVGYYVLSMGDSTMVAKIRLSGEYKDKDEQDGVQQDDTGIRSVFWGPTVSFTFGDSLGADVGAEFPIQVNATGYQLIPSYRLKAALSYRF